MSTTVKEESFESLETYRKNPNLRLNWSSVFVLPGFMRSWWQVFAPEDARLFIRSVWKDDILIGIAPMQINGQVASFIGHKDVFDYIDFVIAPGKETDFFNALFDEFGNTGVTSFDLGPIRPDSTVQTILIDIARARNFSIETTKEDVFVELSLPPTFDAYLEGLDAKDRHEMRRKIRRLMQAGNIDFSIAGDAESLAAVRETFFRLFALSRGEKGTFMTDIMSRFFHGLIEEMVAVGTMRFGILKLENAIIAMVLCFDYNGVIYLYNSGFDPAFSELSPGLLSKAFYIRDAIEQKKKVFDFLKGSEAYKYRMGGKETPIYRLKIGIK
jgi:CelD/BcsL family acetyltransferase involved in cellulose biosynthesis